MPKSLHQFLEEETHIAVSRKCSILLDIARGLQYLHDQSPPIVLGCLTTKNVLLINDIVAKISNFGVSRIVHADPLEHCKFLLSHNSDTIAYIAPEIQTSKEMSEDSFNKLDIFSFGNIVLNVFIQQLVTNFSAFDDSSRMSEVEKRQNFLGRLKTSSVKYLTVQCLDNKPSSRPTASTIVKLFMALSEMRKLLNKSLMNVLHGKIAELEAKISSSNWQKLNNLNAICTLLAKLKQKLADNHECLIDNIIDEVSYDSKNIVNFQDPTAETSAEISDFMFVQKLVTWMKHKEDEVEAIKKILQHFVGKP